jgi:hypothetical protein
MLLCGNVLCVLIRRLINYTGGDSSWHVIGKDF